MLRKIIHNFLSLSIGELVSRVINLVTFVYLARVLSTDGFGIIGFASAIVSYFILLVSFGFDIYGIRNITSEEENNKNLVSSIVSLRLFLAVVFFICLSILSFSLKKDITTKLALVITGINLFSIALSLDWFYQGIQKMHVVAIRQVGTSLINLLLVLLFIKNNDNLLLAVFFSSFSVMINSLILFRNYQKNFFKIEFRLDYNMLKSIFLDASPIAVSSLMIAIYYNLDMVMLGFMKTEHEVGIYFMTYKLLLIILMIQSLVNRSILPVLARLNNEIENLAKIIDSCMWLMIRISMIVVMIMIIFSDSLVENILGQNFHECGSLLQLFSLVVLLVFNESITAPFLLIKNSKLHLVAVTIGASVNIGLNFLLIPNYGIWGAAVATIISEIFVFVFLLFYANRIIHIQKKGIIFLMLLTLSWVIFINTSSGIFPIYYIFATFIIIISHSLINVKKHFKELNCLQNN